MEYVIQTYLLPYNQLYPVVCFDEACKQLFGEVRQPLPPLPGSPTKQDYEYERKGICNQLMMCEPLRGWRHVKVSERRTRRDYAKCLRELVEVYYPQARKIRLVQDNLNTHDGASLYETFPPEQARRILGAVSKQLRTFPMIAPSCFLGSEELHARKRSSSMSMSRLSIEGTSQPRSSSFDEPSAQSLG
jgi:DDE superfamily endonuclease